MVLSSLSIVGFASLFATSTLAVAIPAGGPQGPQTYPVGTVVKFAVEDPSFLLYLSSGFPPNTSDSRVYIADSSQANPSFDLEFITTNETSPTTGATEISLTRDGFGMIVDGNLHLQIAEGATTELFVLSNGYLTSNSAPYGFYFCGVPTLANSSAGYAAIEQTPNGHSGNNSSPTCSDAAFIAIY